MLTSYTVKSLKPTNTKCWLAFNSDRTLTAVTHDTASDASREPVTVSQRLGFVCHSAPSWWVPSCVEGPVSTGEG